MTKFFTYLLALCTFFFAFNVQGSDNQPMQIPIQDKNTYRVGVLYWSMNIPGQVAMRKGLEQQAMTINQHADKSPQPKIELLAYVAGDGEAGIERQIKQMYELVKLKVNLIIVQPTDNAALVAPLLAANKAKIPVVAYDQYISGGELHSYLTSNNYLAGYYDGEYIASKFPDSTVVKLILVEYPHVSSTVERVDGFLDALKNQQQSFNIIKTYEAVEPIGGKRAGKQILTDFPLKNSIDVIFTVNDGGGLSVVDELAKAGRTEIIIATIDGDPQSVKNIQSGRLTHIDSAQFCGPLGAESMNVAYAILTGKPVKKHILIPVFPITQETLQHYPGWLGPIPAKFKKPWPGKEELWDNKLIDVRN